jgi:CheY-like chemotaxis protein
MLRLELSQVTVGNYSPSKQNSNGAFLEGSANGERRSALCKVRVLLADDHQEVIARVCGTLGEEFEIVGTVENGDQAVSAVLTLDPDVLVTDISMPLLNGLEAAKRIGATPDCRVSTPEVDQPPNKAPARLPDGEANAYVPLTTSPSKAPVEAV